MQFLLKKAKWLLIAVGLFLLSQLGLAIIVVFINQSLLNGVPVASWQPILSGLVGLAVVIFFISFAYSHDYFKKPRDYLKGVHLAYIGIGYLSFLLISLIGQSLSAGVLPENQELVQTLSSHIPTPLYAFFIIISAPVCEEILFRGLVFKSLCNENLSLAYALSIGSFALAHGAENASTWLIYGGMGAVLCFVYQRSKSLEVSIGLHMLNNLIAFLLITSL